MNKLLIIVAIAAIVTGCATKSRTVDIKGMFVSESGQLAIGYAHVDAIPEGTESAVIHYKEDVALLSPSKKTHDIDVTLTGTNAVSSADGIVKSICEAFIAVAPSIAKTNAESEAKGAMSPIDLAKANSDNKKAVAFVKNSTATAKSAAAAAQTAATAETASAAAESTAGTVCPNGTCLDGTCPSGVCNPQ